MTKSLLIQYMHNPRFQTLQQNREPFLTHPSINSVPYYSSLALIRFLEQQPNRGQVILLYIITACHILIFCPTKAISQGITRSEIPCITTEATTDNRQPVIRNK